MPATTKKKAATKKKAGATKKEGLRKPQVRILATLNKAGKNGVTRAAIAEKSEVDAAACTEYLGSTDPDVRAANDKKHFPSLIGLGYVKAEKHDVDGKDVISYHISESGKNALTKAKQA